MAPCHLASGSLGLLGGVIGPLRSVIAIIPFDIDVLNNTVVMSRTILTDRDTLCEAGRTTVFEIGRTVLL